MQDPLEFLTSQVLENLVFCDKDGFDCSGTHDDGVLETMEYSMAMLKLYEGAVYMHEGRTFVVQQCDTEKHFAKVLRNDVSYVRLPNAVSLSSNFITCGCEK